MFDKDRFCTPPEIVALLRKEWPAIDEGEWGIPNGPTLDPCSDPDDVIGAPLRYDVRLGEDGLELPWDWTPVDPPPPPWPLRIYVNPPYSRPGPWLRRAALVHAQTGHEIRVLLNAQIGAKYMLWGWLFADAVCIPRSRVSFLRRGIRAEGNRNDQILFAFGGNMARFERVWSKLGTVLHLTPSLYRTMLGRMTQPQPQPSLSGPILLSLFQTLTRIYPWIEDAVRDLMPALRQFVHSYEAGYEMAQSEALKAAAQGPKRPRRKAPPKKASPKKGESEKRRRARAAAKAKPPAKDKAAAAPATAAHSRQTTTPNTDPAANGKPHPAINDAAVLAVIQNASEPVKLADIMEEVEGFSAPTIRRALGRLEDQGRIVSEGRTRSRTYRSQPAQ